MLLVEAPDVLLIQYSISKTGQSPHEKTCRVEITTTPCHYGGSRPWFGCPNCGGRAAIIYFNPAIELFACRKCCALNYSCQQMTTLDWRLEQSHRIRAELRAGEHMIARSLSAIERPKYMRLATFLKTLMKLHRLEQEIMSDITNGTGMHFA